MTTRAWRVLATAGLLPAVLVAAALPCAAQGPADPHDLPPLVRLALQRSPLVREAQANLEAAQGDLRQARAGRYPRLQVSGNTRGVEVGGSGRAAPERAEVAAVYTVYDFGRVGHQIDARERELQAARERLAAARESAAYDTAQAWLQLARGERQSLVYEQHIAGLRTLIGNLGDIVAVFPGRRSELTQARTRLGLAEDGLTAVRAREREAQLALLRHTGERVAGIGARSLPPPAAPDEQALLEQAGTEHPAVRGAQAEAAALRAQADEVRAGRYPEVEVQLAKPVGRDIAGIRTAAQLYLTARWTAFDGFAASGRIQALAERARAAEERGRQQLDEIQFNLRAAASDFSTQSRRTADLRRLQEGTDQVRRDSYDQWRELGRRTLLDVLTAENEHLSTRLSLAAAELDVQLAALRMRHEAASLAEWFERPDAARDGAVAAAVVAVPETRPPAAEGLALRLELRLMKPPV